MTPKEIVIQREADFEETFCYVNSEDKVIVTYSNCLNPNRLAENLISHTRQTVIQILKGEITRLKNLAICPHCVNGIVDCDKCEKDTHNCSDCLGTGERYTLVTADIITHLQEQIKAIENI